MISYFTVATNNVETFQGSQRLQYCMGWLPINTFLFTHRSILYNICLMVKTTILLSAIIALVVTGDTIYFGGTILTMVGKEPEYVECVLVRDGKIKVTGPLSFCSRTAVPGAPRVDLNGKFMMPGFVDPHGHVSLTTIYEAGVDIHPPPDGTCATKQDAIDAMVQAINGAAYTETMSVFGAYIGFGYDHLAWTPSPQSPPNRGDLDQISTTVPVVWIHSSNYHVVVNSFALTYYGITDSVTDPVGGRYYRDPITGSLTGLLEGNAAILFIVTKLTTRLTFTFLRTHYSQVELKYAKFGYTTIADARTDASSLAFYQGMAASNSLKLDVFVVPDYFTALMNKPANAPFRAFIKPTYTKKLRIGGGKLALDGSLQMKTAWLTVPYYVVPDGLDASYKSVGLLQSAAITTAMTDIMNMGLQVHVHCNGDAALDQMLAAVRSISISDVVPGIANCPFNFSNLDDRRIVALHAMAARVDQLDLMVNLKVVPSFFTLNLFYWGDYHKTSTVGPIRVEQLSPVDSAVNKSMLFSQHHDHPVAINNPLRIIKTAVSRMTRENNAIGLAEAINTYTAILSVTRWAAYNIKEESIKGCIKAGLNADFIILSENPLNKAIDQIETIEVLSTIK